NWQGWREVSIPLQQPTAHWGGDGNGALNFPLRLQSILVDSRVQPACGILYLDDLAYRSAGGSLEFVQVTFHSDRPGGVAWGREPSQFRVTARNLLLDLPQDVEMVLTTAPLGGPAAEERRRFSLGPASERTFAYRPAVSGYGLYQVRVVLCAGAAQREALFSFARLPRRSVDAPDVETPFGVCTHFAQGKGKLPLSLELMAGMGARWLRDEAHWSAIEREKGVYTFPLAFDGYLRAAPQYGIRPLVIFDYGNALYDGGAAPASREAVSAFADYAYQLVRRYRNHCRHWEVYNEPNIGFWKPRPDPRAYARLLRATYMAAKRADPGCTVVGVCTAGTDLSYIEAVLKEGGLDYMDALSIHPYRYPRAPEESRFVDALEQCRALLERYGGGGKPIWITEVGWPTHHDARGVSEETAADYLVRTYVQAMSLPFVQGVFWYDFQNDGTDPTNNEHNFGLIRLDFTPKAGYVAYGMMTRALAGKRFTRRLPVADPVYAYEFAGERSRTVAAWSAVGKGSLTLQLDARVVEVWDVRGRCERRQVREGLLTLEVTGAPLFVVGR
ncbi:MAG: glycosyl hydrolase, partial [Armatimonadota bacterium]|nr:glycosyl hydrolase [Armatimonadota bacterium]